ncbi:MAG: ComEC/Rec2 family competence protein [Oscillospiraceae bacterium]|nr:ComEC/Rec2 family competence protein [Oscillospiraceae bacterium]
MKRPLMTACLIYLAALTASIILPSSYLLAAAAFLPAAAIIFFILSRFCRALRNVAAFMLISFLTILSFLIYHHITVKPAENLAGKNTAITATVLETELSESGNKFYIAKLNTIDGAVAPRDVRIRLYCANSDNLCDYDEISAEVSFFSKGSFSSLEQYYLSSSILGSATTLGDITVINEAEFSLTREICRIRDKMVFNIRAAIPDERGNIISAVLFGKRDYIESDTSNLFAAAGISHLLAVSGLHLSIIVSLINSFLLILGLGKISRTVIALIFTVLMMIMTGFTPSIVRAAVMTTIALLAQCIRRDYDAPTALTLSAVIICFANPYAITNIGFLLSFSATAGLIISQNIIEKQRIKFSLKTVSVPRLVFFEIEKLILPCFFAFLFTIPVSACVFGYLATYSPIINLLLAPLLPFMLAFSLSAAIFSLTPFTFIFKPLFYIAKLFISCITWLSEQFSVLPFAKIDIQSDFTPYIVIVFVIIFAVAMLSKRPYKNSIAAALLCIPVICTAVISHHIIYKNTVEISVIEGSSSAVLIKYNGAQFISGFTKDTAYSLRRATGDSIMLVSAESIPSSDVAALTHFISGKDISYLVIPKEHSAAISSVDSKLSNKTYISESFSACYGKARVSTETYDNNTLICYNIAGFKIAHLNIQSPDKLPDDFSCNLLIANSKALPYLNKYKADYFIFSEKAENPEHLKKSLENHGVVYLADSQCEPFYLKQNKLFQKNKNYKSPL